MKRVVHGKLRVKVRMIVRQDDAKASRDRLEAGGNLVRVLGPLPQRDASVHC